MPPDSAKAQISYIERLASNMNDPFARDEVRTELTRSINLRHLLSSEAEKVKKHYKDLSQRTQVERHMHTMTQLGAALSEIWGSLRPSA